MQQKKNFRILAAQMVVLLVAVTIYVLARAWFLYHARFDTFERVFSIVFLLSELFIMFHAFGFFSNLVSESRKHEPSPQAEPGQDASVAILIPARHEPKQVVENTLLTCMGLAYPNKRVYLLDDSSIESYKQEARELAERYDITLFTRADNRGAKAGLINDVLKTLTEKYIAVFDADQNPMPGFLRKVLPFLEADDRLSFVQTPQFYSNTDASRVALISNVQQAVFFEYVCEGKSSKESMFCCGTNVVIRRSALEDVGGFDEQTVTEDVATTLKLHRKGWKSLYYNKAYTFGMAPEDLGSYFKQQNRWAMGNVQLFRKLVVLFFTDIRVLKPVQWFEYAITSTYYFIGWAYLFLLAGPILYTFFNVPSYFMDPSVYVLTFVPYFMLSLLVYYSSMEKRNYSTINVFRAQMLSLMTIPVYIRASVSGLLNVGKGFQVTPKDGAKTVPLRVLWPQLLLWGVHVSALTWGILRLYYEQNVSLLMNVFWIGFHCFMFSGIFYFNRE